MKVKLKFSDDAPIVAKDYERLNANQQLELSWFVTSKLADTLGVTHKEVLELYLTAYTTLEDAASD